MGGPSEKALIKKDKSLKSPAKYSKVWGKGPVKIYDIDGIKKEARNLSWEFL